MQRSHFPILHLFCVVNVTTVDNTSVCMITISVQQVSCKCPLNAYNLSFNNRMHLTALEEEAVNQFINVEICLY